MKSFVDMKFLKPFGYASVLIVVLVYCTTTIVVCAAKTLNCQVVKQI